MAKPATQTFLQFDHIRDGIIVLKTGDLRAILMISSMNFALKSQEEQEAIIYGFENFLNSLDFDLQVFIHSRRLNIRDYIASIEELEAQQENELLRVQTAEYIEFVKGFVQSVNVMSKTFYVVVPYSVQAAQIKKRPLKAFGAFIPNPKQKTIELDPRQFHYWQTELAQRIEFVAQGLHAVGLRVTPLTTPEAVELLWELYNPEKGESEAPPVLQEALLTQEILG